MFFRIFGWSIGVTIVSLVVAFLYGGWSAFVLCLILGVLEVSLSFDNAVVNAKVLERMSEFWQKIFLTVGIAIAVFGMRLVFPLLIVGITANLNPVEAITLAMEKGDPHEPGTYGYLLNEAHPQIAAFGGMFLLMLFLDFVFEDREITWLSWLERPLARIGKLDQLPVVVGGIALVLAAELLAEDPAIVMVSGVLGMITYIAVNGLGSLFNVEHDDEEAPADAEAVADTAARSGGPTELAKATGKAGFFLFLYLEVLDASFSFDGVIGAFAITPDPIIIALGLGFIGAMFVRSITVFLVRKGTLSEYVYLEHGAHWAIGALAAILLVSIGFHVDEIITGLVGVAFIGAAFAASVVRNRRERAEGSADGDRKPELTTAS
ncbi:DUF475 domain-containing protein [Cellulomonas fimi]|uniref:Integral membrane protein TerC n=1 Tax=Cellulomonas fimi (strain ATCC 484 / DSM 20113 / JCM 1341 / CCUG 24087 / LMG 16345 / NBRC 15513 / NCIMB 8980 / NCTC 7547 / NRS-133) TaxID=590998 RepID=F4H5M8_CELFA|nr:DUF475 domain-containing protein [Cellulomonas fimi]AEE44352.1 protein of unknown function DUF475 [Cellulomonas fimi ATCC 484]NNH08123.1 DUF475 domain-containing protein [Cellulomonas fimi]VEH26183.1 integral membrane protein, YkoY family [Cellulomonas fimi]